MLNPKINLLPYREEKKKAIKIRYLAALGISATIGAVTVGVVHSFYSMQTTTQEARNSILETDIASLDKQIEQIKKLRQEIAAAVARKQVVESLQANRSRAVMIFNQIVQPPANIFYKSLRQVGETVTLTGIAPSNTSVSALIKQLENSDVLFDPKLVESKSTVIEGTPLIDFSMSAKLVNLAKIAADKNKKQPKTAPAAQASVPVSAGTLIVVPAGTVIVPALPLIVAPTVAPAAPTPAAPATPAGQAQTKTTPAAPTLSSVTPATK
jgi:type IV pilus assembly protein PilN